MAHKGLRTIASMAAEVLAKIGQEWVLVHRAGMVYDGPTFITPDEDDVERVLLRATEQLQSLDVGNQLVTGGLLVEKTEDGYDAYVYLGNYEGE